MQVHPGRSLTNDMSFLSRFYVVAFYQFSTVHTLTSLLYRGWLCFGCISDYELHSLLAVVFYTKEFPEHRYCCLNLSRVISLKAPIVCRNLIPRCSSLRFL